MRHHHRLGLITALMFAGPLIAGDFDCIIEPRKTIDIRAAREGLIEKVWVERGDTVKVGQVLITLDSGVEKAALDAARYRATMEGQIRTGESRVGFTTVKFNRSAKLANESFISQQEKDQALTEKQLAESELIEAKDDRKLAELESRRLSEELRLRTIRSPVAGIVVDRMLNAGELADNRDLRRPILKLAEIATLHVEALLPIDVYGKVRVGQRLDVLPEEPIGGKHVGKVLVVDRVMDAASGTFGIRLELANPTLGIPAGIKCKINLPASSSLAPARFSDSSKHAIAVPLAATSHAPIESR